ncbi:MAG: DNA translocase FtsK 4TM domain-containing protein [Polyangiaceae bacterium]|nr:DNA translocase FtsK 4TM domain-containing protein [Polyangiaceae bacterium]
MGVQPFLPRAADAAAEPTVARMSVGRPVCTSARAREAAALLLLATAAFVLVALATFAASPHDPNLRGANWAGPVGEAVARFLVVGFGVVAWLVPVEFCLIAVPLFRSNGVGMVGLRVSGDLVVAVILASLVQVALPDAEVFGAMRSGGNVGMLFGELMRAMFSTFGSFLVGSTLVALILIGRSRFSFIGLVQSVAWLLHSGVAAALVGLRRLGGAWCQARTHRREQREEAAVEGVPRIATSTVHDAIIAQLEEDDSDWLGMETTGTPPLALAASLKAGFSASADPDCLVETRGDQTDASDPPAPEASGEHPDDSAELDAPDTPTDDGDLDWESEVADAEQASPSVRRAPAKRPLEPRIIDTRPELVVSRAPAEREKRRGKFKFPGPEILSPPEVGIVGIDRERILEQARLLEKTLADYGVQAKVEEIHPGPTVTTYELSPEAGTKVSRVANLSDDLALGLSRKVRIVAPIPGKARIGFELPNDERVAVNLRELVEDARFAKLAEKAPLPVVLGRDIVGAPFYADLASMPHLIVAGATGSGKSVGLNVMMASLLFSRSPDDMRLLMIDPKVVELAPFDRIPHMLLPVVTDMKQAAVALRWAVDEMERRYQLFADAGTKNITTYNRWATRVANGELPAPDPEQVEALSADGTVVSVPAAHEGKDGVLLPGKLPYIVVVVDEFADLMMQQGKEVEASVARLAQKARAAGMHVVLATQRPSVDVITGMIKANFPSRIAYRVAQKVDSRTILDEQGAEMLLGKGDMLVKINGSTDTRRVQCPFISEEEVAQLTDYLRKQGSPHYHDAILLEADDENAENDDEARADPRFDEAVRIVADTQRCSTSWLQRKMTIGYNRAAKMVEMMEKRGMVGPSNGARDREVLIHAQ